jgi:hypothetical protein
MPKQIRSRLLKVFAALTLATTASAVAAGENKPSAGEADPTFGSRTDRPDGSAALTIGRRLPTEWETKVGTDVSVAAPAGTAAENLLRGATPDRSAGAVWGNLTMPGLAPLGFDKTSVEARLDAGKDEGKVGATLSRSVPINDNLSVSLHNSYSVRQSLANGASPAPGTLPLGVPPTPNITSAATVPAGVPNWAMDETVRLNLDSFGTTFSAGAGTWTSDGQWRNKLSVEQTLVGPLKVTTSVEDAGTAAPKKSITTGFKRVW